MGDRVGPARHGTARITPTVPTGLAAEFSKIQLHRSRSVADPATPPPTPCGKQRANSEPVKSTREMGHRVANLLTEDNVRRRLQKDRKEARRLLTSAQPGPSLVAARQQVLDASSQRILAKAKSPDQV